VQYNFKYFSSYRHLHRASGSIVAPFDPENIDNRDHHPD